MTLVKKIFEILSKKERNKLIVILVLMFVGMLLEALSIGLVIPTIGILAEPSYLSKLPFLSNILHLSPELEQSVLVLWGMSALVVVYLIKNIFLGFLIWIQNQYTLNVHVNLSQRLLKQYLTQPYTFHLQRNSAELIRNISSEPSVLVNAFMMPVLFLTAELMVFLGICVLLFTYEPLGALSVFVILVVFASGFYFATQSRINRWGLSRQYHDGKRFQQLQQGLGGIKEVLLSGSQTEFLKKFYMHNSKSASAGMYQQTLQLLPKLWLELIAVLSLAVLVVLMITNGQTMGQILPTLGLFAAAAFRLMPSMNRIITSMQSARFGIPAVNTIHHELTSIYKNEEANSEEESSAINDLGSFQSLELTNVSYQYANASTSSLQNISLQVFQGESIGFVGESGAGKSTLIDTILALLTPSSGVSKVNGRDVQTSKRNWQNMIGYVPQTIFLIDDTLRNNIAFGLSIDTIDDGQLWNAIRLAQLETFVNSLPEGVETFVGERGVRLSGGQRQRIGIARALYHNPEVLILDEATSSLDNETEKEVMQSIVALHRKKTTFIVAHRLSTVESCDRIYRLNKGRIMESGSPELMLSNKK